jgi:hypothetical protein
MATAAAATRSTDPDCTPPGANRSAGGDRIAGDAPTNLYRSSQWHQPDQRRAAVTARRSGREKAGDAERREQVVSTAAVSGRRLRHPRQAEFAYACVAGEDRNAFSRSRLSLHPCS